MCKFTDSDGVVNDQSATYQLDVSPSMEQVHIISEPEKPLYQEGDTIKVAVNAKVFPRTGVRGEWTRVGCDFIFSAFFHFLKFSSLLIEW